MGTRNHSLSRFPFLPTPTLTKNSITIYSDRTEITTTTKTKITTTSTSDKEFCQFLKKEGGRKKMATEASPRRRRSSPDKSGRSSSASLMENLLGLLRIRVKRGVNLAVRDVRSSDP